MSADSTVNEQEEKAGLFFQVFRELWHGSFRFMVIVAISMTKDERRRTNLRHRQERYFPPPSFVRSQICKAGYCHR